VTTWADNIALGSGVVALRLSIEGWPYEWATDTRALPSGANGRKIAYGLQFDGMVISERAILKDCWTEVRGITAKIKPTQQWEDTMDAFTRDVTPVASLAADLTDSSTTITTDIGGSLAAGIYHIGTEAIASDGAGNITRQRWDTLPQAHKHQNLDAYKKPVPIYDWPPAMDGRRARIYAYGSSDFLSTGTLVWLGVVARAPRLDSDGLSWSISLDPIIKVFDQKVAGREGLVVKPRGIYLSYKTAFGIRLRINGVLRPTFRLTGVYDGPADFVVQVNNLLTSAINEADPTHAYVASMTYSEGAGIPRLVMHTGFSPASFTNLEFFIGCPLVGYQDTARQVDRRDYTANTYYYYDFEQFPPFETPWKRSLPTARSVLGTPPFDATDLWRAVYDDLITFNTTTEISQWPVNRIYVDDTLGLAVNDTLIRGEGDELIELRITGFGTDVFFKPFVSVERLGGDAALYLGGHQTLTPVRTFVGADDPGSVSDFVEAVVLASENANDGDTPWITGSDVATASWSAKINDTAAGPSLMKSRLFRFVKPASVKDIVREELKAWGYFPRLDSTGKVDITPLPRLAAGQTATATITEEDILTPSGDVGSWVRWEAQGDGIVTSVKLRLDFNVFTDEHNPESDFLLHNTTAITEHKSSHGKGTVELALKSSSFVGKTESFAGNTSHLPVVTPEEAVEIVAPYMQCMGIEYSMVTLPVSWRKFGLLVGDVVDVTHALLPNGLGTRGVSARKGIIVGREWSLDPAAGDFGKLTIYFPRTYASGYAPSGRITGQSNVSGNTWDITCATSNAQNIAWSEGADGNVVKHFAAGDKFRAIRVDDVAETQVLGTVVSVTVPSVLRVTFDTTWTPGANTWNASLQKDIGNATTHQQTFAYVSDTTRKLVSNAYSRRFS